MSSETRTTTDHDEIRRGVEEHGRRPVTVPGAESDGGDSTIRRLVSR